MTTSTDKPVVQFSRKAGVVILPNNSAYLVPIDHKSDLVSNTNHVITSAVVRKEETYGRIIALETENTIYMEYDDGEYLESAILG